MNLIEISLEMGTKLNLNYMELVYLAKLAIASNSIWSNFDTYTYTYIPNQLNEVNKDFHDLYDPENCMLFVFSKVMEA